MARTKEGASWEELESPDAATELRGGRRLRRPPSRAGGPVAVRTRAPSRRTWQDGVHATCAWRAAPSPPCKQKEGRRQGEADAEGRRDLRRDAREGGEGDGRGWPRVC